MAQNFLSHNVGSNLHETVSYVNKMGLASFVHSFHGLDGYGSIVIFNLDSYDSYVHLFTKLGMADRVVDRLKFSTGDIYAPYKEGTL